MTALSSVDWIGSVRTWTLAWGIPSGAIIAGLFVDVPVRTGIWVLALAWMGTACLLNARRCGRTHCRFTGPFYLAMIVPVLAACSGVGSLDWYGWLALAALILFGGKLIWWATEQAWGKFS